MSAAIKFVRHYEYCREDIYDVVYESRRCRTYYSVYNLPRTVLDFMDATEPKHQIDKYHGDEWIYQKGV